MSEKEIPDLVDHWAIQHRIHIGDHEVIMGIDDKDPESPYLVANIRYDNPLNAPMYYNTVAHDDYLEIMHEFVDRVMGQIEKAEQAREERTAQGVDLTPLGADACIPGSQRTDYTGQVVVIRATAIRGEYATPDYQLCLATHGNGCRPEGRGQGVFCTTLYSGERGRWERTSVEGIVDPDKLPAWAAERLRILREQEKPPSKRGKHHEHDR